MNRNKIVSILSVIFLLSGLCIGKGWTQEAVLSLNAPSEVYAGQTFEVSYSINVKGSKSFQAPAFKGLDLLFGPMQSQSSSIQFINGKRSQSFSLSYTYQLRAPQAGDYNFGKASIVVESGKIYSEEFRLKVLPANTSSSGNATTQPSGNYGSPQGNRSNTSGNTTENTQADISGDDLFVSAIPSKRSPYVGEQTVLTYRIYTSIPVEQFSIYKTPGNKGFWIEELSSVSNQQKEEIINGKKYIYADIMKVALFPQEAGKHQLEPMEVEAVAQVPSQRKRRSNSIFDIFDDPFFTPMEVIKKTLRTQTIQINAKDLPQEGRPSSFDGLVGDYEIEYSFNQAQNPKTNEAITFRFTVSGKGNIEMIHAPQIQFPPDFEVYEPKISYDKKVGDNGVSGTATFEYIVIPRNPGIYKINGFEYSFFNPQQEKYIVKNIPETVLNIEKGSSANQPDITSSVNGEKFKMLGNDIEYIQTGKPRWTQSGQEFLFSLSFWLCLLGEIVLAVILTLLYRQRVKENADIAGLRNRRAAKEARRCLKKASIYMSEGKEEEFYMEISQALWGFLSNKLNIPTAELSIDNVKSRLEEKRIPEELIQQFIETLDHCEFERFTPSGNTNRGMQGIYGEALDIISKIVIAIH